jgi:HlyD family secretion protein
MKRAIPAFVVLVAVLSVLLYMRLRQQRLEAEQASGGSATVEGTQVDVIARLPARIKTIAVNAGDGVKEGQVLVELDCTEQQALLAQAEAGVAGAEVELRGAQTSLLLAKQGIRGAQGQLGVASAAARAAKEQKAAAKVQHGAAERASKRVQEVHLAGAVSDQTLDRSESQLAGLDHQLAALDANINAARARSVAAGSAQAAAVIKNQLAEVQISGVEQRIKAALAVRERATVAVSECTLRAPRAGYVLERNFEPGEVVLPGSRVLSLVDISQVRATFYLPNAELKAAEPGRDVEVRADTYADQVFSGKVLRVGVEAEFTPRNVQTRQDRDRLVYAVEVQVPNPEGLLRPGMPVEITVPGTEQGSK